MFLSKKVLEEVSTKKETTGTNVRNIHSYNIDFHVDCESYSSDISLEKYGKNFHANSLKVTGFQKCATKSI